MKEKQKLSEQKIHLENARKLRGIYFIDPEDKEFKETIKNARKKLEMSVAPSMPCKIIETRYHQFTKTICRKRWEFITALPVGSQIYSYASSYEDSGSESSGGQGMGKIREIFGVELGESQK